MDLLKIFERDLEEKSNAEFANWLWEHYIEYVANHDFFWFDNEHPFHEILIQLESSLKPKAKAKVKHGVIALFDKINDPEKLKDKKIELYSLHPLALIASKFEAEDCLSSLSGAITNIDPRGDSAANIIRFRDILVIIDRWLNIEGRSSYQPLLEDLRNSQNIMAMLKHCVEIFKDVADFPLLAPMHYCLYRFSLLEAIGRPYIKGVRGVKLWDHSGQNVEIVELTEIACDSFEVSEDVLGRYKGLNQFTVSSEGKEIIGTYDLHFILVYLPKYLKHIDDRWNIESLDTMFENSGNERLVLFHRVAKSERREKEMSDLLEAINEGEVSSKDLGMPYEIPYELLRANI